MSVDLLHVIGQLERGGAEQQLILLADELQKKGWSQAVATFDPGHPWDHRITSLGIPLFGISRGSRVPVRLWHYSRLVAQIKPAIIHSWSLHTNVYTRWVPVFGPVRRIGSFRLDPTAHRMSGDKISTIPRPGIYQKLDCTIGNTQMAFTRIADLNFRVRRAEVVRNMVLCGPEPNYSRFPEGEQPEGGWHLVAAGRLIPLKAYDVLLRALGLLAIQGHQFTLSLAGAGPEHASLAHLAKELKIAENVHFLGEIENVPQLFSTAHIMVHPSRTEGLSNTILEGMAAGLPVVATAVGGTPEIITDDVTGLLVPPDDEVPLAAAVGRLFANPNLQRRLGSAAYQWVATHCAPGTVANRFASIYRSLLPSSNENPSLS